MLPVWNQFGKLLSFGYPDHKFESMDEASVCPPPSFSIHMYIGKLKVGEEAQIGLQPEEGSYILTMEPGACHLYLCSH